MNTERAIHRAARRRLSEVAIVLSQGAVPYEVFRAAAYSPDQAREEGDSFNIALERAFTTWLNR